MSGMALGTEFTPLAFEQINVTTGAQPLSVLATIPSAARHAMIYPEGVIRFRADGTSPTGDIGIIMEEDLHVFENQMSLLEKMVLISKTGEGTVVTNIHWFA